MTQADLHIGKVIYWNDPDDGLCSGYYEVISICDNDIVMLQNEEGSEVEAFISELS